MVRVLVRRLFKARRQNGAAPEQLGLFSAPPPRPIERPKTPPKRVEVPEVQKRPRATLTARDVFRMRAPELNQRLNELSASHPDREVIEAELERRHARRAKKREENRFGRQGRGSGGGPSVEATATGGAGGETETEETPAPADPPATGEPPASPTPEPEPADDEPTPEPEPAPSQEAAPAPDDDEPVLVRPAGPKPQEFAIPGPPPDEAAETLEGKGDKHEVQQHFRVNPKTGAVEVVQQHQRTSRGHKVRKPAPKPTPEPTPDDDAIVNVGEHLHGSRKDLWVAPVRIDKANLQEVEDNEAGKTLVIKSKVFDKINHADDRANGVSPGASHLKAKVLAAVASGPVDNVDSRRDYVHGATWLQKELAKCNTTEDVKTFVEFWGQASSGRILEEETVDGLALIAKIGLTPDELRKKEQTSAWGDSRTYVRAYPPDVADKMKRLGREHTQALMADDDEKLRQLRAERRELEKQHTYTVTESMLRAAGYAKIHHTDDGRYQLSRPVEGANLWRRYLHALAGLPANHRDDHRSKGNRLLKLVTTDSDAAAMLGLRGMKAGSFWDKDMPHARKIDKDGDWSSMLSDKGKPRRQGQKWTRATTENMRIGPDIDVEGITADGFRDAFNFRGVQFGEWVDQASREEHLKRAHEALHDLADLFGLPPSMLSHGGVLGFAFGARGKGKAAAHYEPFYAGSYAPVINLTHTNGSGTIAHEWGHFLDHHLGADPEAPTEAGSSARPYMTHSDANHLPPEVAEAARDVMEAMTYRSPLPPELKGWSPAQARAEIATLQAEIDRSGGGTYAQRNELSQKRRDLAKKQRQLERFPRTDFAEHSQKLGEAYWGSPHEMFARAFESYVEDKLHEKGRLNTYLVHGTRVKYNMSRGDVSGIEAYPQDRERTRIAAAMDRFMGAVRKHGVLKKAIERYTLPRRRVRYLLRAT